MKKLLNITISLIWFLSIFSPLYAYAHDDPIDNQNKLDYVDDVKSAKKIDLSDTVESSDIITKDRYVVFVKKEKYQESKKSLAQDGAVYSRDDENVYGKVKALPVDLGYMSDGDKKTFLEKINSDPTVVAVFPVEKRDIKSVPDFNDPLYPSTNEYDNSKQWYLSSPALGNYGIDVLKAWQYLDSEGIAYNGSTNVTVAVIDTGAAYENYSKYDQFNKMSSPVAWSLSKATDFTSNLFVNSGEVANNQLDDDDYASADYCIDKNSNGSCDNGEPSSFIDDINGINIFDWGRYWSRVTYSELSAAPVCSNAPFSTNGVKCVSTYSNVSYCDQNALTNDKYYGCYPSDMGHPNDVNGHGTFVSNIITSTPNNGIAGVGIASGVKILPIKIFGETYNSYRGKWVYESAYGDQIAAAVNYAVAMGADIINMSFAGSSVDFYEKIAIDKAFYENDVLVVASSGNNASSVASYPAGYESVLSVGASNKVGQRAYYSNYGTSLDLVAPVDSGIISQGMWDTSGNQSISQTCSWDSNLSCMATDPLGSPSPFSGFANITAAGTSFAAPQVVGVAALVKSIYPSITAKQLFYTLKMSAMPIGGSNYNQSTGYGILNANNAVKLQDWRGKSIAKPQRIFQNSITSTGYFETRYSDDFGLTWSSWENGGIKSVGSVQTIGINNSNIVVQIAKGANSGVYTRYSDSNGSGTWSAWSLQGYASSIISATAVGNNIVMVWKGTDSKSYTKYSTNGTTWTFAPTSSYKAVGNIYLITDASNRVVQIMRSTGNYIFIRVSTDQAVTWSAWIKSYDVALTDPVFSSYGDRIIRAVRTTGDIIVSRYSDDGGLTWPVRNRAYGSTGTTYYPVYTTFVSSGNRVIQSYRGKDNRIYTRYSNDNGVNWTTQTYSSLLPSGVYATSDPITVETNGKVSQMVRGSDGYLYYRYSSNGGGSWGVWRNKGSMKTTGAISIFSNSDIDRLIVSHRGSDGYIYTRFSDDGGYSFSSWVKSGSAITMIATSQDSLGDIATEPL